MVIAAIKIITDGVAYNDEWQETDELSLEAHLKETCYGLVDNEDTAIVNVELMELQQSEKEEGENIPDGVRLAETTPRTLTNMIFLYDDLKQTLTLLP